ncbi:aldolase catalytic domain-containing protein [bacterium]|nr:aldolase catalytic domain-containing protein [bacterium]
MNEFSSSSNFARRWVSYRSELKVLDCTIRDGGLMNNHRFEDKIVKSVYNACVEAGLDYMELGYKGSKKVFVPTDYGPWKYCSEDDLRRIVGDNKTNLKLSAMADTGRTDRADILPKKQSVLDMIRTACYIHQIPAALDIIKDAHDKGYETTLNLMAVSAVQESEIDGALEMLANSEVDVFYLVDSFGALYSEQVHYLLRKYIQYAEPAGKQVGMHAHNNQQLAYANTIEAVITGANMLDGSIAGLGRGAGNCPTELLLGFLHNPKYKLRPILQCIQDHIQPMQKDLLWGYDIPYMITGMLNQHPRSAMKFNSGEDAYNIVQFFDQIEEEE